MGGQFLAEAGAGAPRQERRQREGAAVVLLDVAVEVGLRDLGDGRAGLGEPAHEPGVTTMVARAAEIAPWVRVPRCSWVRRRRRTCQRANRRTTSACSVGRVVRNWFSHGGDALDLGVEGREHLERGEQVAQAVIRLVRGHGLEGGVGDLGLAACHRGQDGSKTGITPRPLAASRPEPHRNRA